MERKVNETKVENYKLGGLNALRLTTGIFGIAMIIIGFLLSLTIIGAIIGLPLIAIGVGFMSANVAKHTVKCDNCSNDNKIEVGSKYMICEYCDTTTPLKWT